MLVLIENNEIYNFIVEQNRTFNLEVALKWKLSKFIEDNAFVNGGTDTSTLSLYGN